MSVLMVADALGVAAGGIVVGVLFLATAHWNASSLGTMLGVFALFTFTAPIWAYFCSIPFVMIWALLFFLCPRKIVMHPLAFSLSMPMLVAAAMVLLFHPYAFPGYWTGWEQDLVMPAIFSTCVAIAFYILLRRSGLGPADFSKAGEQGR